MNGIVFVCKHCKRQATTEDIEEGIIETYEGKKIFITVWCPICKVHSHYLKK